MNKLCLVILLLNIIDTITNYYCYIIIVVIVVDDDHVHVMLFVLFIEISMDRTHHRGDGVRHTVHPDVGFSFLEHGDGVSG